MDAAGWDGAGFVLIALTIAIIYTVRLVGNTCDARKFKINSLRQNRQPGGNLWVRAYQDAVFAGEDLSLGDSQGYTFLHYAALDGNENVLRDIVESGEPADLACGNSSGSQPLHLAALHGRLACVQYLLSLPEVDPNVTDNFGQTPLHVAMSALQMEEGHVLLHAGARVNARNSLGGTPLHAVAQQRACELSFRCAEMLIAHGAELEHAAVNGQRPLDLAVSSGNEDLSRLLVLKGTSVSQQHSQQARALGAVRLSKFLDTATKKPSFAWTLAELRERGFVVTELGILALVAASMTLTWLFTILPALGNVYAYNNLACMSLGACWLVCLVTLLRSAPGVVKGREPLELTAGALTDVCHSCCLRRPPRSKHCSRCDCCIGGHEMHLRFLGTCVGVSNRRRVLLLLLCMGVGAASWMFLAATTVSAAVASAEPLLPWSLIQKGLSVKTGLSLQLLLVALCAVRFVWPVTLIAVWGVLFGVTRSELTMSQGQRAEFTAKDGSWTNPYDKGIVRNVLSWLLSSSSERGSAALSL